MKKIFLMLSLSIFALSCENEDTDNITYSSKSSWRMGIV